MLNGAASENGSAVAAAAATAAKGKGAGNGAAAGPGLKRRRSAPDIHAEEARSALPDDDEDRLDKMQKACATLLECLGEDVSREGLVKTPKRMAEALLACTRGYSQSLSSIVNGAVFEEDHHEMILVKDIEIHSLCEHHMVPFTGKVHIAYVPRSKVGVACCVHGTQCARFLSKAGIREVSCTAHSGLAQKSRGPFVSYMRESNMYSISLFSRPSFVARNVNINR